MSQALHQERLMTVIQGPHLSEKSAIAAENGSQVVSRFGLTLRRRKFARRWSSCST